MRAAAGLLLLVIGLCGSQAENGGEINRSDVWTEVSVLKTMLMEAMMTQKLLQTQVNELKAEQARGKQSENAKNCFICGFGVLHSSKSKPARLLLSQRKQRWPFTQL